MFHKYYQDLYTKHDNDQNFEHLADIHPQSDEEDMESVFEKDKLKKMLSQTKNNRTPGPDGLPAEFYKTFLSFCLRIWLKFLMKLGIRVSYL